MATFIIGLVILFGGAALYGRFCEKVFGPDDRQTPAYAKQDGVDFIPMQGWKNSLINLLNIAGTGPILGPIQGILSGFHSTQTAIISRTVKNERQGRMTFYNMMILEGFIAMVWAAGAMGVYNLALQEPNASLATGTIGVVCKDILGPVGGIIALVGVIVLPITSGDTALRALRLSLAETFHLDQSTNGKRMRLAIPVFLLAAAIIVFAKFNKDGFNILWRYFAWSNQTLSLFAFLCITVWMFENGKGKFAWMPLIPGAFYAFICSTYIANAHIGFNIPWTASYIIGVVFAIAYVVALCLYGRKRGAAVKLKMNK